jgi:hypothetical protein
MGRGVNGFDVAFRETCISMNDVSVPMRTAVHERAVQRAVRCSREHQEDLP